MKRLSYLWFCALICGFSLLMGGCLIKPAKVPTHYFVLAPIPPPEPATTPTPHVSAEVGFVKMPSYLLRNSMVVRKSATEIEYLDDALWAQRLDECFRQTLADNLSALLASDRAYPSASERGRAAVRVSVTVEQFDVDTQGQGLLLAEWRLIAADTDKVLKSGQTLLNRTGPSPRANPQVIATTLSALTAEFSRELAHEFSYVQKVVPRL